MVLAPAGIASSLGVHLQKDEISKAALVQSPCGTQAGNASAHDHHGHANLLAGDGELSMIAKQMAHLEGIVHEPALDPAVTFYRESHQRGCTQRAELAPRGLQWLISRHSRS